MVYQEWTWSSRHGYGAFLPAWEEVVDLFAQLCVPVYRKETVILGDHPAMDNRLSWKGGTEAQHVLMDRSGGLWDQLLEVVIQECEEAEDQQKTHSI